MTYAQIRKIVDMKTIPLFPLPLVLFPGGKLPLKIFEPRYIDMVKISLRENSDFGVVMIEEGDQVLRGQDAQLPLVSEVGTAVKIIDFDQLPNGLLGIMVEGKRKFRLAEIRDQADKLMIADIEYLAEEEEASLPDDKAYLADLLLSLSEHDAVKDLDLDINYNDARDVGWRLTELMPFANPEKQRLVELNDPLARLEALARIVVRLQKLEPMQ